MKHIYITIYFIHLLLFANAQDMYQLDFSPFHNRGFVDQIANDGTGGWTDEGSNNSLEQFPIGIQTFHSIDFKITDPDQNNGKSCTVLKSTKYPFLPDKISIPAGLKTAKYIYVLHALANYDNSLKSACGTYRIVYQDKSISEKLIFQQQDILNWWEPQATSTCIVAWRGANKATVNVGVGMLEWENPFPNKKIERIEFQTLTGKHTIILIAATLSNTKESPDPINPAGLIDYDKYGGWKGVQGTKTGYFHTQKIDGVWWLIDPAGNAFISKGVNAVRMGEPIGKTDSIPYKVLAMKKYVTKTNWEYTTISRLWDWNFNTIGSWSDTVFYKQMPYTHILNLTSGLGGEWFGRVFPDVFSSRFEKNLDLKCAEQCATRKNDKLLIGYFSDNELPWAKGADAYKHIAELYLEQPIDSAGHKEVAKFLCARYSNDIESFNKNWNTSFTGFTELFKNKISISAKSKEANEDCIAFMRHVSAYYFGKCASFIKKYDPNHLYLGARMVYMNNVTLSVYEGMRGNVDVVSVNHYQWSPAKEDFKWIYEIAGAPIIISEFAYRAIDSGLPNSKGAGKILQTQEERAFYTRNYINELEKLPFAVGYHWFKYTDQPKEGRFDGENSNYGLVDIYDNEYRILVNNFRNANMSIEKMHQSARLP